jgi:cell division protein FtsN
MMNRERRQTPRMKVEPGFEYIHLEPGKGGSILNVSEGGLCFLSLAPVQQTGTIHFWFSPRNQQRIEGDGELAWTDETQKRGGLRFTNLPPEAREQIHGWISQPAIPLPVKENVAPSLPMPHEIPAFSANQLEISAARDRSARLERPSPETKAFRMLSGFSGGLLTGLLVSTLLAVAISFLHSYRRELGDSLIDLGERLGARSQPQGAPPPTQIAPAQARTLSATPIAAPHSEKLVPEPRTSVIKSQPVRSEAAKQVTATPAPGPRATRPPAAISTVPPPISLPTLAVVPKLPALPDTYGPVTVIETAKPPTAPAENSRGGSVPSILQMYFEVGKFKEKLWAYRTSDELTQLGFHATVVQKGRLWTNSYYVLVGPYGDDEEAETVHKNLWSRGFKARAFQRGSRNFVLRPGLTLNQTQMPAGDCIISWESYVTHAKVKFVQQGYVVATAEGRWVKSIDSYDAVVYRINADGSRTLLEIQFAGMDRALAFSKSS